MGDSLLRKYLAGAEPGLEKVKLIADAADVRLEWLATGEEPMKRGGSATIEDPRFAPLQDPRFVQPLRQAPPGAADAAATFEAASLRLDSSALVAIATWWFEFLDAREAAGKPRWSAEMRALGLAQIYLGATASGRVDESSIKEVLRMFD